jgi:hypothetical protein
VKKKIAAKEKRAKQKFLAEGETGKNVQRHGKIACRKTSKNSVKNSAKEQNI